MIDDDRGQMDAGGHGRLVVGVLITLTVVAIVLDEMFTVVGSELRGERITELGGPWMTPAEGVGLLVLGAIVIGSVHLASWVVDRRSPNADRDSPNGEW